ncbi:uncharacterized protein LOC105444252 [Strongylocentrotus purpuratus]|uniref:Uncharacterized protein n=1 Tax=Strongylocentrotus purpuratus TaxID=7668 RepID=A0A7M7HNP6_STRPU|nr:uncharacterized protein LOC105444252 [Strongylocentrotus purpuratus]
MIRAFVNFSHLRSIRLRSMVFHRNTCGSRRFYTGKLGGSSSFFSHSRSSTFDGHRSRNFPEARLVTTPRKMSSTVPAEWRKFITKFQEAKTEQDGLAKIFINKDLSYGEFNKFGKLNPWCIFDYCEASLNLFQPDFTGNEHLSLFGRNVEVNLKEGTEGRIQIDQALKFKICLTYLGKSSAYWEAQCMDLNTDEELANYWIQMVTVDMKDRKPKPFAYLLEDFCPKNLREEPPNGFDLEFKPETAFKHEFVVNWSDTDFNSHLNQADMCRMCVDCGSFAATQNYLSAFSV